MLVCFKKKYLKFLKIFLKEETFKTKLKLLPSPPVNLHFNLAHQENMPYL